MKPIAPNIEEHRFSSPHDGTEQTFLLKDFRQQDDIRVPLLLIYLHGAESHQEQGMSAEIYGNAFGKLACELEARNAVYLCPEYRGWHSWMGAAAECDLLEILRWAKEKFRPEKTILMGGSMGGTSTLIFGMRNPSEIDGIIALCPATEMAEIYEAQPQWRAYLEESYGGSPSEAPQEYQGRSSRYGTAVLAQLPMVVIHGSADALLPVHHSRLLVADLKQREAKIAYKEIENGDHDSPLTISLGTSLDFVLGNRSDCLFYDASIT